MNPEIDCSTCRHKKLIRKKDLLWQCTRCESYFTVNIQDDDKDYVWLKSPSMKSEVDQFIGNWWCRPDKDKTIPDFVIKNKICEVLSTLDSNLDNIIHIDKNDVQRNLETIRNTTNNVKKWFYILCCFEKGSQSIDDVMIKETTEDNKCQSLVDEIKSCMIYNPKLGGRYTLEIDKEDAERIMYLTTGKHQNSKCPDCDKNVSCVCTECNHVWYCPEHILHHKHMQMEIKNV